jgi:hypothetical protein
MSLESGSYIKDLVVTNPEGTDPKSQGDDHLRLIKSILKTQFSGFTLGQPITLTEAQLNAAVQAGQAGINGKTERVTGVTNTDANALPQRTGFFAVMGTPTNGFPNMQQGDTIINMVWDVNVYMQFGCAYSGGLAYYRSYASGAWTPWRCLIPIGIGQTWATYTRLLNTNYINNTSRTITVSVGAVLAAGQILVGRIGGVDSVFSSACVPAGGLVTVYFQVPPGATYAANPNAGSVSTPFVWAELR